MFESVLGDLGRRQGRRNREGWPWAGGEGATRGGRGRARGGG